MAEMTKLDWVAFILVVVGALNWGLAIWDVNLVALLSVGWLIKTVYALVALSGIWMLVKAFK